PVLEFIHSNQVIHRDIKPSNIMRHQDGRLYLLDFGAVKQVTSTAGASPGRSTGIYSMGFAPPEQMQGSQVYPATDLYALAATCLNLLSGKDVEELYDSYDNAWNWKPHVPQISPELSQIFDRMLLATPKQRFQSAQEVLDALNLTTSPVSPSPNPPQPQTQNPPPAAVLIRQSASSPATPPAKSRFSLLEIMASAGFLGFEGALLLIALTSLIGAPPISIGLWGMSMGGLIYAVYRRLIEKVDLVIIGGITLGLVLLIPALRDAIALSLVSVTLIALFAAAGAIAITTVFQLIYLLLARFL
ncbi:MAG: protein kinase domain-containing protein, partial [Chroococcales cyanobacterium]